MTKEKQVKLSATDFRIYSFYGGHFSFRRQGKQLQPDGSCYLSNAAVIKGMRLSRATIKRAKKRLAEAGLIRWRTHHGRGKATDYWICDEPVKEPMIQKTTFLTHAPLNAAEVRKFAAVHSKEMAVNFFERGGYEKRDIESCFEEELKGFIENP